MGFLKFISGLTGDSTRKVSRAHHDARDHSGASSGRDKGSFKRSPSWASKSTKSGFSFFRKGK